MNAKCKMQNAKKTSARLLRLERTRRLHFCILRGMSRVAIAFTHAPHAPHASCLMPRASCLVPTQDPALRTQDSEGPAGATEASARKVLDGGRDSRAGAFPRSLAYRLSCNIRSPSVLADL